MAGKTLLLLPAGGNTWGGGITQWYCASASVTGNCSVWQGGGISGGKPAGWWSWLRCWWVSSATGVAVMGVTGQACSAYSLTCWDMRPGRLTNTSMQETSWFTAVASFSIVLFEMSAWQTSISTDLVSFALTDGKLKQDLSRLSVDCAKSSQQLLQSLPSSVFLIHPTGVHSLPRAVIWLPLVLIPMFCLVPGY